METRLENINTSYLSCSPPLHSTISVVMCLHLGSINFHFCMYSISSVNCGFAKRDTGAIGDI